MLQAVDLSFGARDHARIAVAHADGHDATKKVEILLALDVPNMLHQAAVHGQRIGVVVRDRRKYVFLLLAIDFSAREAVFSLRESSERS